MLLQSESLFSSLFKLFLVLNVGPEKSGNNLSSINNGLCKLPQYTTNVGSSWSQKPYTIIIEGTVGAGKYTLVAILAEHMHRIAAIPEPVDQWQHVNGTNMLQLLFQDPNRWQGAFQMESTLTRIKDAVKKPVVRGRPALVRIMERSLYSERYCFMEYSKRNGMFSDPEFNVMDLWHKFAMKNFETKIKPDLILFLRVPLEIVAERIKKRGRTEEQNIDLSFVDGINRLHEDWLVYQNTSFPVPAPVVMVDASLGMEDFKTMVKEELLHKIIPSELQPLVLNN